MVYDFAGKSIPIVVLQTLACEHKDTDIGYKFQTIRIVLNVLDDSCARIYF